MLVSSVEDIFTLLFYLIFGLFCLSDVWAGLFNLNNCTNWWTFFFFFFFFFFFLEWVFDCTNAWLLLPLPFYFYKKPMLNNYCYKNI